MANAKQQQQDAFKARIREAGLRVTSSRLAVLKLLANSERPLSHGELADALEDTSVDRATVFRNLQDMTEIGMLRRKDLGDRVWRYELATDAEGHSESEHPHFVCSDCGTVSCLSGVAIAVKAPRNAPATLRKGTFEIQLRGVCDACA